MPTNNQSTPARAGSYIPRNAVSVRLFLQELAGVEEGTCTFTVPQPFVEAMEREGLITGRAPTARESARIGGGVRRFRITPAGRAALADYEASLGMHPHDADDFLKARAMERSNRRAAA